MFDKRLMRLCPESRKYIIGNVLTQWAELFCNAGMIAIIAELIGSLYAGKDVSGSLLSTALLLVALLVFRCLLPAVTARMSFQASATVKQKMRELIYDKLLKLGPGYRESASTAELVQESVDGVDQLESYFGQYVPQFFYAFLAPVTLFLLFGFAGSWLTGAVLLICVPLIPGAIMMVQKIAKKLLAKYWGEYTRLGSTFLENLQGMTTLKIYQADEMKNAQMNAESERFRRITMKVLTMQLNSIIIMDFFAYGGAAVGILLAARALIRGELPLANCLLMILLSAEFFLPMRRLGSYFHVAMNGMAASDKIFRFLSSEEPERGTEALPPQGGAVALKDVHFSYEEGREVLHGITMDARPGELIGIVGESGCGKSTVAALLTGKRRPGAGQVTLAGHEVTNIREKDLARAVTAVGTGPFFFRGTVRENLLLARPDAKDGELTEVMTACALTELPEGLDTELNENAGNLSGGQRQRLALARALLHDSPVYIFDEATSNIDVESEEKILEVIRSLSRRKTVIMISHRLANVTEADRIYTMQSGKIVESGTHGALLEKNGVYAALWRTQRALETLGREAV